MSNKSDRTLRGSEVRHQAGSTSCSDVLHQLAGQTSNLFSPDRTESAHMWAFSGSIWILPSSWRKCRRLFTQRSRAR